MDFHKGVAVAAGRQILVEGGLPGILVGELDIPMEVLQDNHRHRDTAVVVADRHNTLDYLGDRAHYSKTSFCCGNLFIVTVNKPGKLSQNKFQSHLNPLFTVCRKSRTSLEFSDN
jgi:hypothetical protein